MSESIDGITQEFIRHMAGAMRAYQRLMAVKRPIAHVPVQVRVEVISAGV